MQMLKIVGGALIIGASSLIGYILSRGGVRREAELLEMKRALTLLKNEIRFSLTPFGEAAANVSGMVKSPVCELFAEAGQNALAKNGAGANEIWQEAVTGIEGETFCTMEDLGAIRAFGKSIGSLDSQAQEQTADLLIEYINGAVAAIRESSPARSKMYRSLGFLGGTLVTVLLL